jgi:hypothetical protein
MEFLRPTGQAVGPLAGLLGSVEAERVESGATRLLTFMGYGRRDPDSVLGAATRPATVPPRFDAVRGATAL